MMMGLFSGTLAMLVGTVGVLVVLVTRRVLSPRQFAQIVAGAAAGTAMGAALARWSMGHV